MSEEFIPKNKQQAEGYAIGKSFVQGFTDQIKEKDAEIAQLKAGEERLKQHLADYVGFNKEKDAEIARLQSIAQGQKEALDRWAASCDCEQRAREVTK